MFEICIVLLFFGFPVVPLRHATSCPVAAEGNDIREGHPSSLRKVLEEIVESEENDDGGSGTEPELLDAGYYEGDMILNVAQVGAISYSIFGLGRRNGVRYNNVTKTWPNGVVVYRIVEGHFSGPQTLMIETAMKEISRKTCLLFRRQVSKTEPAVTIVRSESACASTLGYHPSRSKIKLAPRCFKMRALLHELVHTVGFYHMQSNYNRDKYVKIHWDNIQDKHKLNFLKYDQAMVMDFGLPYDYNSITHYRPATFSKNGDYTITPLIGDVRIMGPRRTISQLDVTKINKMYNCQ